MATRKASNRFDTITTADNGNFVEYGPASTATFVATMTVQFAPTPSFVGSLTLFGKVLGSAGDTAPFLPLAYRRVNVAGVVGDYALTPDPITSAGIIQIPANGLTLALLVTCTAGTCQVYLMDSQGPSAV